MSGRSMNMERKYKLSLQQVHKAGIQTDCYRQYLLENEDDDFPKQRSIWKMSARIPFPKQHKSKLVTQY